jgi:molybdopterin synthase catalytic subunit
MIRPFGCRDLLIVNLVPLEIQTAVAFALDAMISSVTSYIGTTSGFINGKEIACIVYEANISNTQLELSKLSQAIRTKYPTVVGLALIVRIGMVKAKEANLVVAVSAPIHGEAIEACTFASQALENKCQCLTSSDIIRAFSR